jgi:hypothetical protein
MDKTTSKRITSLRFLLVLLVVTLHAFGPKVNFQDSNIVLKFPDAVYKIEYLFSMIIASIAVPMFFLLSGYLVGLKKDTYSENLKKKFKSVLVPFLIWNSINILFYFVLQSLPITRPFFFRMNYIVSNFQFVDWLDAYTGMFERSPFPFLDLSWFLRDLFLLNLLLPLIFTAMKKIPAFYFFMVFILWINGKYLFFLSSEALLFFSLGCFWGTTYFSTKFIDMLHFFDIFLLYAITVYLELFYAQQFIAIHKFNIIIGIVLVWKISSYFIRNEKLYRVLKFLSVYSFFVYVSHEPLMTILRKLSARFFPMDGIGILFGGYFLLIIIDLTISLSAGIIIKRINPRLYNIMVGGRLDKKIDLETS